jgi:hypothetical protein
MANIISRKANAAKRRVWRAYLVIMVSVIIVMMFMLLKVKLDTSIAEIACVEAGYDGYTTLAGDGYCWTLGEDGIPAITGRVK